MTNWQPPRQLLLSWLILLALLSLTVLVAYEPLGVFNTALALTIALIKMLLVGIIFMELHRTRGLTIAVAASGFFWLAIMLWLVFADYTTRATIHL